MVITDLDRDTRKHLLLHRYTVLPIAWAHTPSVDQIRAQRICELLLAKSRVAGLTAEVSRG